jgi:hypothetical protein
MTHPTDPLLLGVFFVNGLMIAYAAEHIWMVLFSAACSSFAIISLLVLANG